MNSAGAPAFALHAASYSARLTPDGLLLQRTRDGMEPRDELTESLALRRPWIELWHSEDADAISQALSVAETSGLSVVTARTAGTSGRWTITLRRTQNANELLVRVREQATLRASDGDRADAHERRRFERGMQVLAASAPAFIDNLDRSHTLRSIVRAVTQHFASFCVIDGINEAGEFERIAYAHRDVLREHERDFVAPSLPNLPRNHFVKRTLIDGEASVAIVDDRWIAEAAITPERAAYLRTLGFDSVISVPIKNRDERILGALIFGLSASQFGRQYDPHDLVFAEELARRAGLALSNAQRYERELRIALTFQEYAMPRKLPAFIGLHLSAEYRPGKSEARIGGDWYDTFALSDGRIAIIVGDVIGNGLHAAAVMNRLRQAMQTATLINPDPNFVLDIGDTTLRMHDDDMYATAIVALYDPATWTVTYASAGHPGPIVIDGEGTVTQHTSQGLLLGLRTLGEEKTTGRIELRCGEMMVVYTDGITEISRDLATGQLELEAALHQREVRGSDQPATALVDAVLRGRPADDDIAVFVLRVDGVCTSDGFMMYYHDIELAHESRRLFTQLLAKQNIELRDRSGAEIVFGELVGNVLRHAPGPVCLRVVATNSDIVLDVIDTGPGYAIDARLPGDESESERGLFLVHAFARDVCVQRQNGLTITSVRLDRA